MGADSKLLRCLYASPAWGFRNNSILLASRTSRLPGMNGCGWAGTSWPLTTPASSRSGAPAAAYSNHSHYQARLLLRSARRTRRRQHLTEQRSTPNRGQRVVVGVSSALADLS
jgi:hypothetical protein